MPSHGNYDTISSQLLLLKTSKKSIYCKLFLDSIRAIDVTMKLQRLYHLLSVSEARKHSPTVSWRLILNILQQSHHQISNYCAVNDHLPLCDVTEASHWYSGTCRHASHHDEQLLRSAALLVREIGFRFLPIYNAQFAGLLVCRYEFIAERIQPTLENLHFDAVDTILFYFFCNFYFSLLYRLVQNV